MIRENRAVPILLVLSFAFILYLAGCFGAEEPTAPQASQDETPIDIATTTPAPVVTQTAQSPLSQNLAPFEHLVEEGEDLGKIASKYNVTTDVILLANPDLNPDLVLTGQKLRIPGATTNNSVVVDRVEAHKAGQQINYVVEQGDTIGEIASTWTVTIDALLEANPEVVPKSLRPGQLLVIPTWGSGYTQEELAAFSTRVPVQRRPNEILYHPVEPGDVLSALAELYSVSPTSIMEANQLEDEHHISVGDVLAIPAPEFEHLSSN